MEPGESGALLAAVAAAATGCLAVVDFEQIRPNDPFGMQMVTNIAHRGCPLRGVAAVPDLPAQVRRFRRAGWAAVAAVDLRTFYYRYLPLAQRRHIESRELLDEVEEWHLLLEHYALVWGARDPRCAGGDGGGVAGGDADVTPGGAADADDPSVRSVAGGQLESLFVRGFLPVPVPGGAGSPDAPGSPRLGWPGGLSPGGRRPLGRWGGADDLFPGAHVAGAE